MYKFNRYLNLLRIALTAFFLLCASVLMPVCWSSQIMSYAQTVSSAASENAPVYSNSSAHTLRSINISPINGAVRYLGRGYYQSGRLIMAYSGSGCEFSFYGNKAALTFIGDNTSSDGPASSQARIAIYVNGEKAADFMMDSPEKTVDVISDAVPNAYTVKVIKLSESSKSIAALDNISVNATDSPTATANRPLNIEFVGDSITCGFGIDDTSGTGTFSTSTEDITKTYAYLACEALNADCSVVAFSGYGLLPENTVTGSGTTHAPKTVSQYYDKIGYSSGHIGICYPQNYNWTFLRTADVVVINLGTNDAKYISQGYNTEEEFVEAYKELITEVFDRNPKAKIICSIGMMDQTMYPAVERAVSEVNMGPGIKNVFLLRFDPQLPEDGYATDHHPSALTHARAAEQLANTIREIL
ncbi:MAG: GDSL-type esterase/lipase family protein [Eubacteriales bacterium]|nr:GDSL-type esterase/lipase family protein [Eubacteriales bacterium]